MEGLNDLENKEDLPKFYPVFIGTGSQDPVGEYGKAGKELYQKYRSRGMEEVSLVLYQDMRHELLHEVNKDRVYGDLLSFLDKYLTNLS